MSPLVTQSSWWSNLTWLSRPRRCSYLVTSRICTTCRNRIGLPMHFVPPAKGGRLEKGTK